MTIYVETNFFGFTIQKTEAIGMIWYKYLEKIGKAPQKWKLHELHGSDSSSQ